MTASFDRRALLAGGLATSAVTLAPLSQASAQGNRRASANDNSSYLVLPTIYRMKQGGQAKSAAGTMTFVMTRAGYEWKIASWTYSAPVPK